MSVLFVAAGDISWGSSRMRCFWPAPYMGAEVMTIAEWNSAWLADRVPERDVYIFQKLASAQQIAIIKEQGKRVYWDVCDPSWWFQPAEARAIAAGVDGVVASNPGLAKDFSDWSGKPCHMIPDRLELSHFDEQRKHANEHPVRLIWFGVSVNRIALLAANANLERLRANGFKISLTVMDNQPELPIPYLDFPAVQVMYSWQNEVGVLAQHDIALLPPYPGPWGDVKSNNKTLSAWACNVPVTQGIDYAELEVLVRDVWERERLGAHGLTQVQNWRAEKSAREWEEYLRV